MQPIYRFPAINRPQQPDPESPRPSVREERAAAPLPDDDLDYFLRRPQAAAVQPMAQAGARACALSAVPLKGHSPRAASAAQAPVARQAADGPFRS